MVAVVVELFKDKGVWRLNQPDVGFSGEPLVCGMESIVDGFMSRMNLRQIRFDLTLSPNLLDDSNGVLMRDCEDASGYWYVSEIDEARGWLGRAGLELMFKKAPTRIYYRVDARDNEVPRSS